MTTVLVVDNHDSFIHTLVGYLHEIGAETRMVDADALTEPDRLVAAYDAVLISPGPGAPEDAGSSVAVVHAAAASGVPLLGVCLGHQAVAVAFGATVAEAPELMHGMTSTVRHDGSAMFAGMPDEFTAGRYHSLAVDVTSVPSELRVTAHAAGGTIMAIEHRHLQILGVQFHPESVLTEGGHRMLGNWLESIGLDGAQQRGARLVPHRPGV